MNNMNIDKIAEELVSTAEWRSEKAAQHPDSSRNMPVAEKLTTLAAEVRELRGTPIEIEWNTFLNRLDSAGDDKVAEFFEASNLYRSRIGFDSWPKNGEDYLREVMRLGADT